MVAVMRARAGQAVAAVAVLLAVSGCIGNSEVPPKAPSGAGSAAASGAIPGEVDPGWVDATIAAMTIEEKVGQLFVARVYGTTVDTTETEAVKRNTEELGVSNAAELVGAFHVGGIVYFGENVTTPTALAEFGNGIQQQAGAQRVVIPVLTSMDQEQGNVVRVGPPATQFPGSMALGAGRSREDANTAARITGEELRAMGVFQDYAPVADVNVDPDNPVIGVRSFSSRPSLVASMVKAQVRGYWDGDVASTAKHFPGHGDTAIDSHTGLPVISHSAARMRNVDLRPFRAAIAAGVDSIMTAHIQVPALDPSGDPATLSKPIVTGLLRKDMGFDGVIVTDSLRMEGVRTKYGDDRVPVLAIQAGVDQLLDPPNLPAAYTAVLSAVAANEITIARLDQSVRRILTLKASLGLTTVAGASVDVAAVDGVVGSEANRATATAVTDRTTTVVRDEPAQIPMTDIDGASVLVTGWGKAAMTALATNLRSKGADVTEVETGVEPDATAIASAVSAAADVDLVVATTYDVSVNGEQEALVDALIEADAPLLVAAVGTPYDIALFPEVPTFVATYSYQPIAMDSLVRVLTGEVPAVGRLPVAIPAEGPSDRVLYPFGWPEAS
jgi:beta-N-acetylhexosaminidase